MTDEQVKKGAACCADSWGGLCRECPYDTYEDCETILAKDALALIHRLEEEKEQVRKETAKSIIHELKREFYLAIGTFNPILARELRTLYLRLQQEYGIEEEE